MKKQDLCEWTSRALRAALTPKNIIAGFQATGIWPLNRTAMSNKLHAAVGFEPDETGACDGPANSTVTRPTGHRGPATGDGEAVADHQGRATGPAGTADWATVSVASDQRDARGGDWATEMPHSASDPDSADSDDAEARLGADSDVDDLHAEVHVSSPCHDENTRPLHFYVDVPDADESTYPACDRSVGIDPGFHAQLREDDNHDISSFLVLLELIPARKRKRQQPLLDFTRSKILTSEAYTEGCERLLAQREANQEQTRRRAADREATKEQCKKEKEEKHLQVQARKEARAAKKVETEHLQAKRRARREGSGQGRGRASDSHRSSPPGEEAHMVQAAVQVHAEAPAPELQWPTPATQSAFFFNPTLMLPRHFQNQPFQRSHDLNGHP